MTTQSAATMRGRACTGLFLPERPAIPNAPALGREGGEFPAGRGFPGPDSRGLSPQGVAILATVKERRLRPPRRCRAALAGALVAALAAVPAGRAAGDVVTTKDGKTYEGKVVSQDDAKVVVETTFDGAKELPRADVKSVDTTTPPLRDQLAYRAGQAKGDAPALVELTAWAKSKGFSKEID